jgi:glycosyltransferase involved in cell wall biosynthesis
VYYAPVDEDFGMVPFEAFLSRKPVLTTHDAGGPLEIVSDRSTGLVTAPEAPALAEAAGWLRAHPGEAEAFGTAGQAIAARVTWDGCIERLLS